MKYQIVIPARKNSKRLVGKNLKKLNGIPLIQYSIDLVKKEFKNCVWVNSDDDEILNFSKAQGVNIVKRPLNLGLDNTRTVDVLKFQLDFFKENNINCEAVILLQPTNPFRDLKILMKCIDVFESSKRNSLATFSILKRKFGKIKNNIYEPENYIPGQRSQDICDLYFENGSIYIVKSDFIYKNKIITKDVFPLVTKGIKYSIDIDTSEDFELAEALIKKNHETPLH